MPSFQFGEYNLRPAVERDLPLAQAWNSADPDHGWELGQERYWIENTKTVNSFVLEDAQGPVFFFRAIRLAGADWIEISLQFDRQAQPAPLWRMMNGMTAGLRWLEKMLPANGVNAIYFSSKSERLIRFAIARLGFEEVQYVVPEVSSHGFRRFRKAI